MPPPEMTTREGAVRLVTRPSGRSADRRGRCAAIPNANCERPPSATMGQMPNRPGRHRCSNRFEPENGYSVTVLSRPVWRRDSWARNGAPPGVGEGSSPRRFGSVRMWLCGQSQRPCRYVYLAGGAAYSYMQKKEQDFLFAMQRHNSQTASTFGCLKN